MRYVWRAYTQDTYSPCEQMHVGLAESAEKAIDLLRRESAKCGDILTTPHVTSERVTIVNTHEYTEYVAVREEVQW